MGALSSTAPEFSISLPRLCVSALSGGGGKTLLTLGLARAASAAGVAVKPFKKGPDYIDAAWLALAAGRPATNLDPFFLPPARLRALF
ncbi:MAG: cobyrinic acid a,c-diamide synthase, partial [Desulfovibrio sp.]|nr:cobyrinic acid a,c-diamide synthase [Desulfovibrio sp.]